MTLPVALAIPQVLGRRPDQDPAACYLASLAPSGRRSQRIALAQVASLLGGSRLSAEVLGTSLGWDVLRYQHLAYVRAQAIDLGYAPATVNRWLAAMRGVVRQAWLLGYTSAEQYERARQVPPAHGARLPKGRCLSREEVKALLVNVSPGDACAYGLMYGAGLRVAEVCGLDVEDASPERGEVRVVGKGNKERVVPLPPVTRRFLEAFMVERGSEPGPLFRRLHPNTLASRLGAVSERLGMTRATPHDLRRTFATLLLDAGEDLALVQGLMGHADPRTTARYDRRPEGRKRQAVGRLDL